MDTILIAKTLLVLQCSVVMRMIIAWMVVIKLVLVTVTSKLNMKKPQPTKACPFYLVAIEETDDI